MGAGSTFSEAAVAVVRPTLSAPRSVRMASTASGESLCETCFLHAAQMYSSFRAHVDVPLTHRTRELICRLAWQNLMVQQYKTWLQLPAEQTRFQREI